MNKIRYRQLKGAEIIEIGDLVLEGEFWDLNGITDYDELLKYHRKRSESESTKLEPLPIINPAFGLLGKRADGIQKHIVWRPEIVNVESSDVSAPQDNYRKIDLQL